MTRIEGATVVVTGAAGGIGRATAYELAGRGARLMLTDRDAGGLAAVAKATGALHHAAFDISDHAAVAAFAVDVAQPVDIVMNVAGIAIWGAVEDLRHEDWRKIIEINLMGPTHVIEAFVAAMVRARRGGHLVLPPAALCPPGLGRALSRLQPGLSPGRGKGPGGHLVTSAA